MKTEKYDFNDLVEMFRDDFIEENKEYFLEWLEDYNEFKEYDEDNNSLNNDPYNYYGVSKNDF